MSEKRVGVLGATSLAGECLLRRLISCGWHVTAFSRRPVTQSPQQITWQQLLPASPGKTDAACKIPFWICAAPIWVLSEHLELLLAYGAKRLVVLSSTSRFTKNTSSSPAERKIAQQLIECEELVQTWSTIHGIEWLILRPTLIYGYGRDKNISEIARVIRRFGFFPLFGAARGLRQPVHVDDVAAACCTALDTLSLANRSYNLAGGETLSYRQMVKRVFEALGQPCRMLTVPLWFFQMATYGLRWLPRYRHWTPAMAERMNQDLQFDSSEAQRDLNFFPRTFKLPAADLPDHDGQ